MIVFELTCDAKHRFEGWFASGDDFNGQTERGLLSCPTCGTKTITKIPTANIRRSEPDAVPAVSAPIGGGAEKATVPMTMPERAQMQAFVEHILASSEDVGKQFADEARRIHREEAPARSIRGQATREETEDLLEEGIPVLPLPVPPKSDWH
jgi:hypothetical protein